MDQEEPLINNFEETNGGEDETTYDDDMLLYENMHPSTPAQVDNHLDFIKFNEKSHLILGSSNLTGRYWGGSMWYYDNSGFAPEVEKCTAGIEFMAGLTDIIIQSDGKIILGQDGGIIERVSLVELDDGLTHFTNEKKVDDHTLSIVSLKLTADKLCVISASLDMSIRLWDSESLTPLRIFDPAHIQDITSMDTHPTDSKIFISSSLDGNVLFWDLKNRRPASCVFRDFDDPPTFVCFIPEFTNSILVGTHSGKIHLRKIDVLTHSINEVQHFNRRIHRIVPNPFVLNEFAVCADDSKVVVLRMEGESFLPKYANDDHTDFVRGLAWKDATTLFSCGWDKKVIKHAVEDG